MNGERHMPPPDPPVRPMTEQELVERRAVRDYATREALLVCKACGEGRHIRGTEREIYARMQGDTCSYCMKTAGFWEHADHQEPAVVMVRPPHPLTDAEISEKARAIMADLARGGVTLPGGDTLPSEVEPAQVFMPGVWAPRIEEALRKDAVLKELMALMPGGACPPTPRWRRVLRVAQEYLRTLGRALRGDRVEEWEE